MTRRTTRRDDRGGVAGRMHATVRAHAGTALAVPLLLPVLMLAALRYMYSRTACMPCLMCSLYSLSPSADM